MHYLLKAAKHKEKFKTGAAWLHDASRRLSQHWLRSSYVVLFAHEADRGPVLVVQHLGNWRHTQTPRDGLVSAALWRASPPPPKRSATALQRVRFVDLVGSANTFKQWGSMLGWRLQEAVLVPKRCGAVHVHWCRHFACTSLVPHPLDRPFFALAQSWPKGIGRGLVAARAVPTMRALQSTLVTVWARRPSSASQRYGGEHIVSEVDGLKHSTQFPALLGTANPANLAALARSGAAS